MAATSEAAVGSTAVADRSAEDTEADLAVATTGAQVILADTPDEAAMVVDTVLVVQPLLAPGLGRDATGRVHVPTDQ